MILEYRHERANTNDFQSVLNSEAQDGWRLHSWNIDADYPVTSEGYISYVMVRPVAVREPYEPPRPRPGPRTLLEDIEELLRKVLRP